MRNFGTYFRRRNLPVLLRASANELQVEIAKFRQVQQPRAREKARELFEAAWCQECSMPCCRRPDDQQIAVNHAGNRRR